MYTSKIRQISPTLTSSGMALYSGMNKKKGLKIGKSTKRNEIKDERHLLTSVKYRLHQFIHPDEQIICISI